MSDFAALEEDLGIEINAQLASETITVSRNRVAGALDPDTRLRDSGAITVAETCEAITSLRIRTLNGRGQPVTTTRWTVLKTALTFAPSPDGIVEAADGSTWRISRAEEDPGTKDYEIHGVRIS